MSILKKSCLTAVILGLGAALSPSAGAAADSPAVRAAVSDYPVAVNGTVIDARHSEYPPLVYKGITYFPMTWSHTTALGLTVDWKADSGLSLTKTNVCAPFVQPLTNGVRTSEKSVAATVASFPVQVNGKPVSSAQEPYPILLFRNITYFPMTWTYTHDEFGWQTSWDDQRGFGIEACGGAANAQSKQADALNVANDGQLAVQGDWIYMNPARSNGGANRLVKVRKDGSEETKLSDDNPRNINVEGDWLYYTVSDPDRTELGGIYKMKTDGTERTRLSTVPAANLWVRDGWISYIHLTYVETEALGGGFYEPDGIRRMRTDGADDRELVAGRQLFNLFVDSGRLYFLMQDVDAGPRNLYAMRDDGTELVKLRDDVTEAAVIDGWVYYVQGGTKLRKASPDGSVDIPLYESGEWISSLHYREGWLYFINGSFGVHGSAFIDRLRIDGTGHARLLETRATAIYFVDRWLYYPKTVMFGDNKLERLEVE
ncbi:DUF5050 domain-containing protein [Paenibacillus flagellatus]|uniref:DUF5050 domain-containing protein n=1 Tax=Paenibacillus flagellatus TaxID=2211139 RepID=A0A2V5KD69_9BACL|nr:DUF5050 domain-containing protein [Paenibacillus flagellatus]PYI51830.1 DUF5050 domain-containing protein [Paenibacillus flagellatus]